MSVYIHSMSDTYIQTTRCIARNAKSVIGWEKQLLTQGQAHTNDVSKTVAVSFPARSHLSRKQTKVRV